MSPTTPPLSSYFQVASTAAALLGMASCLKLAKFFSSFIARTSLETGAIYSTSYLLGRICDQLHPNTSFKAKIIFTNLMTVLLSFFIFRAPVTSLATSLSIFNLQSYKQDAYFGLSNLFNRAR